MPLHKHIYTIKFFFSKITTLKCSRFIQFIFLFFLFSYLFFSDFSFLQPFIVYIYMVNCQVLPTLKLMLSLKLDKNCIKSVDIVKIQMYLMVFNSRLIKRIPRVAMYHQKIFQHCLQHQSLQSALFKSSYTSTIVMYVCYFSDRLNYFVDNFIIILSCD